MDSSCELDVPIREGPQRLLACSDFVEIEQEDSDRSSPSSDSSSGSVEGACQTCLSVCQADCCQLLLRYKSWKSPAIVEGVMFVLIFAYGCMYHVTVQYTYEHIWQAANSAMTNTTLPHADTVPTEQRTFRFSLFASLRFAALGLAFMLSSYFVEYIHFGGTFVVIMLLFIATLVYIIFVLPESSAIGKMRTIRDFNPIALFISSMLPFEVFARERPNRQHQYILLLLLVTNFFESAISFGSFQVLSRLVVAPPFCSHPDTVTLLQMFVLVLAVAGPFIAIQLFSERLPDAGIGTVASLLTTIGLAIQALSSNYVTLVIGLLFQIFVPIPNGVSRSIMSKLVAHEEQGALQAGVTSARALGAVTSTFFCISMFQKTVGSFPGITLIVLSSISVFVVVAFILTWGLLRDDYEDYKLNVTSVRRFALQRYHEIYNKINESESKNKELSLLDLEDYDSDEVFSQ
ncbi:hypothetical protein CAPTEDRAFT_222491 [Capitella teleta]|uniref:Major facilitator superfamily (MFS) profile domain-containing protein n=1 Tax=Capitella teleta TaxID=283909 RepID=R7TSZ9_CAPTE|nr:hypothetical protein CAPTEDRAFT_222491 [Capitella teleta]|eukprot:ELT96737.1 hypothetical protein CAPTEDRAFT_222491 [Capitella teleta]